MQKKLNAVEEVRKIRNELHEEWGKDPIAFWKRIKAQGDAWRAERAAKKEEQRQAAQL